jgi:hypothetical protein
MRRKQRGITAIGWIFLLAPFAVVGYAAIRLTPIYLNYTKVARTLEQVSTEFQGSSSSTSATEIRNSIARRFDIESINHPSIDMVAIRRTGQAWAIEAGYDETAPLFGNISLLVTFDKAVEVR